MNKTLCRIALLLVLATLPAFAGKKSKPSDDNSPPDTGSTVASVSTGSAPGTGTITINGNSTPFSVVAGTIITLDNKPATLSDVKSGQLVVSCTAPGSSAPEIDLKTAPATPTSKKNKQKS